jgi:putative ubiquitin-RnfH superfamily antitoxin RatB of RatAB toxin-antitoxin module
MRCAFATALAEWQGEIALELPDGATAAEALRAARSQIETQIETQIDRRIHTQSGTSAKTWSETWEQAPIGIFGEPCERDQILREGDRVELYRPLAVDPKAARRARAKEAQTEKGRNPLTAKPRKR